MTPGLNIPGAFEAMRTEGGISVKNKKRAVAEEGRRRRKMTEMTVTKDGRLETGMPLHAGPIWFCCAVSRRVCTVPLPA